MYVQSDLSWQICRKSHRTPRTWSGYFPVRLNRLFMPGFKYDGSRLPFHMHSALVLCGIQESCGTTSPRKGSQSTEGKNQLRCHEDLWSWCVIFTDGGWITTWVFTRWHCKLVKYSDSWSLALIPIWHWHLQTSKMGLDVLSHARVGLNYSDYSALLGIDQ